MDLSSFIDKLLLSISEDISNKSRDLEEGNVKNFEHYRYVVGTIDGLKRSKAIIRDMKRKFFHGDEDFSEQITKIIARVEI